MGIYRAISSSNRKNISVLFSIIAITFLNIGLAQDNTDGLSSSLWSDSNIFRTIPDGSVVEGSSRFGGLQPDYIVDKKHPALKPLWEHVESISSLPEEEKVASIVSFIRDKLLPRRDYNDPKYLELLKKYRDLKREIPLGDYAVAQAGVCREYALLTHLALEDAGIPNRFLYVTDGLNEDHAINVIQHKGELVTVDAYETSYSGRRLKDLMQPGGVKPDSYKAPWAKAITQVDSAKFSKLHSFPKVWSPNPSAPLPNRATATSSVNTSAITIKIGPELTFTNEEMLNAIG